MVRRAFFGIFALALVAFATPPASAANVEKSAEKFVRGMADEAISKLTGKDLDGKERRVRFRKLMNEYFAVKSIAKWVLGRHWRRATKTQRVEYLDLFENMLVERYADQFSQYSGESLTVKEAESRSQKDVVVHSSLIRPGISRPIDVAWRLGVVSQDKFKVVDIIVSGLSLSLAQKKEFASVIRQNDNEVESLLKLMREMVQNNKGDKAEVTENK